MVKVRERNELVTVNASENLAKLIAKNYAKPKKHTILLPYFDELEVELDRNCQELLDGLVTSVVTESIFEATDYEARFLTFTTQFGLRITKEKYLSLVRFFYEAILKEHQLPELVKIMCNISNHLIRVYSNYERITVGWRDLTLDWRPMYDFYMRCWNRKTEPNLWLSLEKMASVFSIFYAPSEQPIIWETILQELTIGNQASMEAFTFHCWNFFTCYGKTTEEVKMYATEVWIKELWQLYLNAEMNTNWTSCIIDFITEMCMIIPQAFDPSPYYDVIFTKIVRSLNLKTREGKTSVGCGQEIDTSGNLANLCVYTIGGPNSSLSHFKRLIKYVYFNVHPTNMGDHTGYIVSFIFSFLDFFKNRIREERLRYRKRDVPQEYYLTDKDIDEVAETITDTAVMLMFSENTVNDGKILRNLVILNREVVAPKLLDQLYSAITAVSEPARMTTLVSSFYNITFEIIRPQDPQYRKPREIIFDSTWILKLEEMRKQWPTYKLGSEVHEIQNHKFTSLRAHAFYIMEIYINNIDVNDVDRTSSIFSTLFILFSSFPLMDFSSAIKYHQMSDDDKILCLLSKRIPHLIEVTFEKLLKMITCLSTSPPKASGGVADMATSATNMAKEGGDETVFKAGIGECMNVLFVRIGDDMRCRLFDILFHFLKGNEFANRLATDLLTGIVRTAIWASPREYKQLAEYVVKNLRTLITPEVQESKKVSSCIMFHVLLARSVYGARHDLILENEAILMEITDLLINCKEKTLHDAGLSGLRLLLEELVKINTEPSASPANVKFTRPLNEWNPIEEWAKCIDYKDVVINWFIPAKPEIECVKRLANRFFFPLFDKVLQPGLDRDRLRQYVNLMLGFIDDLPYLDHPKDLIFFKDIYTPFQLPAPPTSLGNSCKLEFELKGPNGENVREMLVTCAEELIKLTQDPVTLTTLVQIVSLCIGRKKDANLDRNIEKCLTGVHRLLSDGSYIRVTKASQHTIDELAFFKHIYVNAYCNTGVREPNNFDQRVLEFLTELSLNDYEGVRRTARDCIQSQSSVVQRCRDMIIPKIVQALTDQTSNNKDRLAGAMCVLTASGLAGSINPKVRLVIWDAVMRIKQMDDALICFCFEQISNSIKTHPRVPMLYKGTRETYMERSKKLLIAAAPFLNLADPSVLPESLQQKLTIWQDYADSRYPLRMQLVDHLFAAYIPNKNLHHTRAKLARSMVYRLQKERADERTIRMMLSQLLDEEYDQRLEARQWLVYLLAKKKPKTIRKNIKPPPRVDHGVSIESGVREDNLWVCYDSKNLPDTEEKWNEMIFVTRDKGSCRWPETLDVVRPRKEGPPLEVKEYTPIDKAIIEFFSDPEKVNIFFKYRDVEKDELASPCENIYKLIKYVIRNYPNETKPLENFVNIFKSLLKSRERTKQLLAAEMFIGIVLGLKHHPFPVLDAFWKDITVQIDKFFNIMVGEAEDAWLTSISLALARHTDIRRQWWLVESLMQGAEKTAGTDLQQSFRVMNLTLRRWRCVEVTNRVVALVWKKLPNTVTDMMRTAIATTLRSQTHLDEVNGNATFINVDARFRPASLDQTLEKFVEWIPQLRTNQPATSAKTNNNVKLEVRETRKRMRSASLSTADQKKANLYLRTLLEYVLQYYESMTRTWSPNLVKLLPKFMEYANEDDMDCFEENYLDLDITQYSSLLIHEYMSGSWLPEKFMDEIIAAVGSAYRMSKTKWRLRQAAIKFIMASVYSNIFTMCSSKRKPVENLLFEAVYDENVLVRTEVHRCLVLFIHCGYIHVPPQTVDQFAAVLMSPSEPEWKTHGAASALGAIVTAFPFSLPTDILKPLQILNSYRNGRAMVKKSITGTLREFRRQHREDWAKTTIFLGEKLTYDIENALAPAYYA